MRHFAILAALLASFVWLSYPNVSAGPFSYDEADYMYAAQRGFIANYLDLPSTSFPDYVRLGLNQGRDLQQKAKLSQAVRKASDIFFFRHAHGPVYFYWLTAVSHWNSNEHFMRAVSLIFPIVTAIALYFGSLWIFPAEQGALLSILATASYLWSPAVIRTTEIAPHQMFVMWFTITLLLLARLLSDGTRRIWYAAVGITAIAFCTLEVPFVLIAVVAVCGYLERRRLEFDWRLSVKSLLLFAGVVILVHPGSILKLAAAKSYLYYAYLAVGRKSPWGNATLLQTWSRRFTDSPVEWTLVAVAVYLYLRRRNLPHRWQALPFFLFGTLMLITMLRVLTTYLRYVLPFLPALLVFAAIVCSGVLVTWRPASRIPAVAALCAALLLNTGWYLQTRPFKQNPTAWRLIEAIKKENLDAKRLLVPHDELPTLHYYFPQADLVAFNESDPMPPGQFDAVVRSSDPVRMDLLAK
ncbi:MAG: hypothetical protein M3Z32_11500 [Acidobacteriota bacterium]|nr:hypothetical protein [Acidobacteriota bacterium]